MCTYGVHSCYIAREHAQSLAQSNSLPFHGLQPAKLFCPWEFSRQDYWSWLLCPPPGDLPNPGTEHMSLLSAALVGGFFTTNATWEALLHILTSYIFEKNSVVRRTDSFKVHCQDLNVWEPQFLFSSFHFHTFLHYQLFPSSMVCNILSPFLFSFRVIIFYVTMPRLFICFFLNGHFGCVHFGILKEKFSYTLI